MAMNKIHTALTVAVFLCLFLLGACGGSVDRDPLSGTAWTLTAFGDNQPIPGTALTIEFSEGRLGGSSGCNMYGATYETRGEKITIGDIESTLMACLDEGAMDQEGAFLAFLQEVRTFSLNQGQLQLLRPDGQALTFTPLE